MSIKAKIIAISVFLLTVALILSSCGATEQIMAQLDTELRSDGFTNTSSKYVTAAGTPGKFKAESETYSYAAADSAGEKGNGVSINTILEEQSDRKIIYSSWADIETKEYDNSINSLRALCQKYGAYFESSNSYGGHIGSNSGRHSSFTIRIPVEYYSAFVSEVGDIGTVVNSGENNRDVTEQYYDTQARLDSANLREERVLVLLENAGSLDDILALERELSDIRYEIENLTGSLRKYDSLISYATFTLNVNEVIEYSKPVIEPLTFGQRLSQSFRYGLDAFVDGWQDFVISISYNVFNIITFIIVAAVIVAALILIVKRAKKKHSKSNAEPTEDEKE